MVSINDIVSVPASSRYGVVTGIVEHGRRKLAVVHYICATTGEKMVCPDAERCKHADTCPIHGRNIDTGELEPWGEIDINYYRNTGMLSEDLARKALAPEIVISRTNADKYRVQLAKHGQSLTTTVINRESNVPMTRAADRIVPPGIYNIARLTDPDTSDYNEFLALFVNAAV